MQGSKLRNESQYICLCVESIVPTVELLTVDTIVVENLHGPGIMDSSNPHTPGDRVL